eukprot:scaffold1963_cov242-Pinguiococcus_pyrenoidosus.AAC.1
MALQRRHLRGRLVRPEARSALDTSCRMPPARRVALLSGATSPHSTSRLHHVSERRGTSTMYSSWTAEKLWPFRGFAVTYVPGTLLY